MPDPATPPLPPPLPPSLSSLSSPPTPAIPLAALLARRELGLRQVAGPEDADLYWVHTSEMADPYPYLLGGELILTAGVQLTDPDRYVSRVVQAGAAALGFGLAPVYDTVPPALPAACERHGLPLIEVPPATTFSGVARAVWRLMAEARHHELRRVAQAQQGLAAAAARPDPVPAVLHQLTTRLGGAWAVLLSAEGEPLTTAGRAPSPGARAALTRLAQVVTPPPDGAPARPAPASATDTAEDGHLAAYALAGGRRLVLGVISDRREAGDHTIAGVAAVLLALLTAPHQSADAADRAEALVRLLLGTDPQEVAPLLGAAPWTVVHARGQAGPFAATALGAALGSALVDRGNGDDAPVRVLLPAGREAAPQPGWVLGASTSAGEPPTAEGFSAADAQAARALARATALRVPLVRHAPNGLDALIAPEDAAAHARTRLAPLGRELRETLRVWLSLHGGWDRTAVATGLHRNTVRQRIARCAALLDADLDDMDVRAELWVTLRGE